MSNIFDRSASQRRTDTLKREVAAGSAVAYIIASWLEKDRNGYQLLFFCHTTGLIGQKLVALFTETESFPETVKKVRLARHKWYKQQEKKTV